MLRFRINSFQHQWGLGLTTVTYFLDFVRGVSSFVQGIHTAEQINRLMDWLTCCRLSVRCGLVVQHVVQHIPCNKSKCVEFGHYSDRAGSLVTTAGTQSSLLATELRGGNCLRGTRGGLPSPALEFAAIN